MLSLLCDGVCACSERTAMQLTRITRCLHGRAPNLVGLSCFCRMQQYLTSTLAALVWVPTDVSLQAALASAAASAAFEHFCADLDACVLLATVDLSSGGEYSA